VHTAQGVTADTTHAVLGENTTRSLLYVAMTRGRHTNTAHFYQRTTEHEYGHQEPDGTHLTSRGDSRDAADIVRAILANHDPTPVTAHDYAAQAPGAALPDRVRSLLNRRTTAAHRRRATYEAWRTEAQTHAQTMSQARERAAGRDRSPDTGIEL
jgi:ATP-dependent exoDNAse (exonuclease V) beta subunit